MDSAELQAEVERRVGVEAKMHDLAEGFLRRAEAAEAKAESYRKALENIQLHACNHGGWVENDAWGGICEMHQMASQALAAGEAQP